MNNLNSFPYNNRMPGPPINNRMPGPPIGANHLSAQQQKPQQQPTGRANWVAWSKPKDRHDNTADTASMTNTTQPDQTASPGATRWKSSFAPAGPSHPPQETVSQDKSTSNSEKAEIYDPFDRYSSESDHEDQEGPHPKRRAYERSTPGPGRHHHDDHQWTPSHSSYTDDRLFRDGRGGPSPDRRAPENRGRGPSPDKRVRPPEYRGRAPPSPDRRSPEYRGRAPPSPDRRPPEQHRGRGPSPDRRPPEQQRGRGPSPDRRAPEKRGRVPSPDSRAPENRGRGGPSPDRRAPENRGRGGPSPDRRAPENRGRGGHSPDRRAPENRGRGGHSPDGRAPEHRGLSPRVGGPSLGRQSYSPDDHGPHRRTGYAQVTPGGDRREYSPDRLPPEWQAHCTERQPQSQNVSSAEERLLDMLKSMQGSGTGKLFSRTVQNDTYRRSSTNGGEERIMAPEVRKESTAVRLPPPQAQMDQPRFVGTTGVEQLRRSTERTRTRSQSPIREMETPFTCELCMVQVASMKDLERHLESKSHWDTLEYIQQQKKYDDLTIAFLQEVMMYKVRHVCKQAAEEPAIEELCEKDHMTKVEMLHCAACKVYVSKSTVLKHLSSQEHLHNKKGFGLKQKLECLSKAETMMKELKPQYEHFLKGADPFE